MIKAKILSEPEKEVKKYIAPKGDGNYCSNVDGMLTVLYVKKCIAPKRDGNPIISSPDSSSMLRNIWLRKGTETIQISFCVFIVPLRNIRPQKGPGFI